MIRSLRTRHRVMIPVLAIVLIALFLAAMIKRPPAPVAPTLPPTLFQSEEGKR